MAETFSMRVDGLRELQARLKEFAPKLAAKALGASVNAGAKVIKDDAIARAPYYTGVVQDGHPPPGTLRRSIITVKIPKESNQYKKVYAVTVRTGLKYRFAGNGWKGQDAFYWRFVEFGHFTRQPNSGKRLRKTDKGEKNSGSLAGQVQSGSVRWVPAQPFMRPAFEMKKNEALQAMQNKLADRIKIEVGLMKK